MNTSGKQNYCVIGSPIGHSLSPYIMTRAFAEAGIDAVYTAVDVPAVRLEDAMRDMAERDVRGANVTFPLKETVLAYTDRRSPAVEAIGAANTLISKTHGIEAHNTDAPGTARALQVLGGVSPADRRVIIFGGGGAARAAAYGLLDAGASEVSLAVRDPDKARAAAAPLRAAFDGERVDITRFDGAGVNDYDIVINATPLGMDGVAVGLPPPRSLTPSQCYFDFVYNPRSTEFLRAARSGGACVVDGLALLVAQAEESFYLWTGRHFSLTDMYADLDRHAGETSSTETNE